MATAASTTQGTLTSTVFDFASNTWTAGPNIQNGRWYPSNTTLATGEVLTLSGGDTAQATNLIPEVYQSNGTWRVLSTASLYLPYYSFAFVTPTGSVFVAGPSQTTYFLDPTGTGHWTSGPSSLYGYRDYGSALMYDLGKIFMVGGGGPTASAEVIDLNAGAGASWRSVPPMAIARRQSNATILADGKVLVTGGTNSAGFNVRSDIAVGACRRALGSRHGAVEDARAHDALSALSLDGAAAPGRTRALGGQWTAIRNGADG